MKLVYRITITVVSLAACLMLAGCPGICLLNCDPPPVWVSDDKMSFFISDEPISATINFSPNASSLTYWEQGPFPEFAAEKGACPPDSDYCGKLFYTSGGKLFVVDPPGPSSTPVARTITTQYTAGTVAWDGGFGSVLYVTYPSNAAVGVIGGVSEREYADPSNPFHHTIRLPGTTPFMMAVGAPSESRHYMLSGNPGPGQQLIAFDDNGPIGGVATPTLTVATSLAANRNFVAVVAGGRLLVYNPDLTVYGFISSGPKGWNPYSVVVDQDTDMAYVTSLSGTTTPGQVNAVDLESLTIVGPSVTVGNGPFNTRLSWDGSLVLVANQNDGTVSTLKAGAALSVLHTVKVGSRPGALTIHP